MTSISARRVLVPAALAAALVAGDAFAAGWLDGRGSPATWLAVSAAGVMAVVLAGIAVALGRAVGRRERSRRDTARDLNELLLASDSARESQRLLIAHAQRVLLGAGAGVLTVAESGDRLEPTLAELVDQTPLRGIRTAGLPARACLAMRLGHGHARDIGDSPLATCEVCGALEARIACDPLVSGGEVIGTILVAHDGAMSAADRAVLRDAAGRAAPILAAQREQAFAEERAMQDTLTGLPNRRAADETIRRMVAHAGRSLSPVGVVLLDLDRFRVLNDLHGHTHGDKVLAAVGRLLTNTIRASDFAARFGGEEFLLVLADTDRQGCLQVAEKVRRAIEQTELVQTGPVTASFGVACLPDDAVDPEQLVRQADRALYMAKAQGRNRVQGVEASGRGALGPG
ncbi:MAG TPA: GGDEF domain-containing protein [Solirubrobacteraceae bacterium]